ncbi:MAG: hypothetical protein DWP94_14320 [Flavobacterium sp.]|nr:MAG: hypothetical protein DWP94_14320 [Flavobacterium sp.]
MRLLTLLLYSILISSCNEPVPRPQGSVQAKSLKSVILNREIAYNMYLPATFSQDQTQLDIIYLLHGHGGDHNDWFEAEEGNVAYLLGSLIAEGAIPPMAAVSINAGNSWYVNSREKMERFYLDEFVPHFEESVGYNNEKGNRSIAGNSAGGYGALRFSLQHPELFKSVILLSPAAYEPVPPAISSSRKVETFTFNGKFNDSVWQSYSYTKRIDNLLQAELQPQFYLSVGDDDNYNIVPVVTSLQQLFLENNVACELRVTNGGHDWQTWRKSFSNALTEFYVAQNVSAN